MLHPSNLPVSERRRGEDIVPSAEGHPKDTTHVDIHSDNIGSKQEKKVALDGITLKDVKDEVQDIFLWDRPNCTFLWTITFAVFVVLPWYRGNGFLTHLCSTVLLALFVTALWNCILFLIHIATGHDVQPGVQRAMYVTPLRTWVEEMQREAGPLSSQLVSTYRKGMEVTSFKSLKSMLKIVTFIYLLGVLASYVTFETILVTGVALSLLGGRYYVQHRESIHARFNSLALSGETYIDAASETITSCTARYKNTLPRYTAEV